MTLPSGMFYSLHQIFEKEATPAGRRGLPGQRNHLEDSFKKDKVFMHICTCGVCFQISDLPQKMFFPSSILQLLDIVGV